MVCYGTTHVKIISGIYLVAGCNFPPGVSAILAVKTEHDMQFKMLLWSLKCYFYIKTILQPGPTVCAMHGPVSK